MGQLGSSSAPSFAGWQQHSVTGYQFASKYTSPAFDVFIQSIHAFFSASVSSAVGQVAVWNGSTGALIASVSVGTMSVGGNSAGAQAWRVGNIAAPGTKLPASTPVWIGGHSNGGIVWSTYDTTPNTYQDNTGNTSGPTTFVGSNTAQGPCGAYIIYSPINYGSATMGNADAGLSIQSHTVIVKGSANLGSAGGGLQATGGYATQVRLGTNGAGLAPVVTNVKHNLIAVWRPR